MNATTEKMIAVETAPSPVLLPINTTERETGVSKELLRMWERRYGFPDPQRDAQGDRIYPIEQVTKLRVLRRLIEQGFRPGKIIGLPLHELEHLLQSQARLRPELVPIEAELMAAMKDQDPARLQAYLAHQMTRLGLQRFIQEFLQPVSAMIGDAWMNGTLAIHEEHLFTEQVQTIVRQSITALHDVRKPPRVLLATPTGELHTLGLLMVESMLRLEDCDAVSYGAQMSPRDIAQAVQRNRIQVAAISFSAATTTSKAIEFLEDLRFRLPLSVEIWAGGAALRATRRSVEAVHLMQDLQSIPEAVQQWRRKHGGR